MVVHRARFDQVLPRASKSVAMNELIHLPIFLVLYVALVDCCLGCLKLLLIEVKEIKEQDLRLQVDHLPCQRERSIV